MLQNRLKILLRHFMFLNYRKQSLLLLCQNISEHSMVKHLLQDSSFWHWKFKMLVASVEALFYCRVEFCHICTVFDIISMKIFNIAGLAMQQTTTCYSFMTPYSANLIPCFIYFCGVLWNTEFSSLHCLQIYRNLKITLQHSYWKL